MVAHNCCPKTRSSKNIPRGKLQAGFPQDRSVPRVVGWRVLRYTLGPCLSLCSTRRFSRAIQHDPHAARGVGIYPDLPSSGAASLHASGCVAVDVGGVNVR
jgi:hypothetical protein